MALPARGEGVVAPERRVASGPALEHRPQLAPECDPEVEGGADALRREGQAVAGRVADEEHVPVGGVAKPVRNPVALVADGLTVEALRELDSRLTHVEARIEGADADAHLVAGGEAPAVSRRHDFSVDPD